MRRPVILRALAGVAAALLVVLALVAAVPASAALPQRMVSFQGRLLNSAGAAQTGTFNMTFAIYSTATGGVSLWAQGPAAVNAYEGVYNVELGPVTLPFDQPYWVGVTVGADAEMLPRVRLASQAFAMVADTATGMVSGAVARGSFSSDSPTFVVQASTDRVGFNTGSLLEKVVVNGSMRVDSSMTVRDTVNATSFRLISAPGGSLVPPGVIMAWPAAVPPAGWLVCNGTSYSAASYPALFSVIGTTYGGGAGTFLVPDLRARVPAGMDGGGYFTTLGKTGGQTSVALTNDSIPTHTHSVDVPGATSTSSGNHTHVAYCPTASASTTGGITVPSSWVIAGNQARSTVSPDPQLHNHGNLTFGVQGLGSAPASGSAAHDNLKPYTTMFYVIKY